MRKSTHQTQKSQEKRIASRLKGSRQPMSGSKYWAKGDAVSEHLLIDAKQTEKKSISVKLSQLDKANEEAMADDKIPALSIEFLNCGKLSEKDWLIIPLWHYKEMMSELSLSKKEVKKERRLPF